MNKTLLALSLLFSANLFAQFDDEVDPISEAHEGHIGEYLPVDLSGETIDKITAMKSSVCELRSSQFEELITILDPITGQPVRIISTSEFDRFYCSGVVVSDNTFLTASHCNQVNIEQNIQQGKIQIPGIRYKLEGRKITWTFNRECYDPTKVKPEGMDCSSSKITVKITEKMHDVYLVCKNTKNEVKKYIAPANQGWPNPRFSANRPDFDITVWKTKEKIDKDIVRARLQLDLNIISKSIEEFGQGCKTMGFGPMNLENAKKGTPTFKILNTPATYLDDMRVASVDNDYLRPGDSGGGFFCQELDGNFSLFGINSRIYYLTKDVNVFALNSFNAGWINQIFKLPETLVHEGSFPVGSPIIYHAQALKYEQLIMEESMKQLKSCIKNLDYKANGGFAPLHKKNYQNVKKEYEKLKKLTKEKKESLAGIRSQNKGFIAILNDANEACSMLESRRRGGN